MSIRVKEVRRGTWMVDVRLTLPDGRKARDRRRVYLANRTAALSWGRDRERAILDAWRNPPEQAPRIVPTLAEWAPRLIENARGNARKPSYEASLDLSLRRHLLPALGDKRLDAITTADVEALKARLASYRPSTVNTLLSALSQAIKLAIDLGVLDEAPCRIKRVKVPKTHARFHDEVESVRLVEGAQRQGDALVAVLLGLDAGLRCGEMAGLRWTDLDFARRLLRVERSRWHVHEHGPKSNRSRTVPMTTRLADALAAHRHLRGRYVLSQVDGRPMRKDQVEALVRQALRVANLPEERPVHTLRHSFCSRLAMAGAPVRAIMELAGHADITTTLRYMHLSPGATDAAIRLLERAGGANIGATWADGGGER